MNKELVYENIKNLVESDLYLEKYTELSEGINLEEISEENRYSTVQRLEEISANIFNAIVIGSQLFDDQERIIKFVERFKEGVDSFELSLLLPEFGLTEEEACERLMHGYGLHFTTGKIAEEIYRNGKLVGYGNNAMFTEEEDSIINNASRIQQENDPVASQNLRYLYRGWGTGVSSYSSMTNQFWMYHTPESLSFLFGNISDRDKERAMAHVANCIDTLPEEEKIKTFKTMSNIWDRLIGDEQEVCCVLIDRDAFEYEVDYYYDTEPPRAVERRPYSKNIYSIDNNDNKIKQDVLSKDLKFIKVPTVMELERRKKNNKQY